MVSWTAREIADVLMTAGFVKLRQGATSHVIFRHPDGRKVVVSMHRGDIKDGTLSAIRRQSSLPFRK